MYTGILSHVLYIYLGRVLKKCSSDPEKSNERKKEEQETEEISRR